MTRANQPTPKPAKRVALKMLAKKSPKKSVVAVVKKTAATPKSQKSAAAASIKARKAVKSPRATQPKPSEDVPAVGEEGTVVRRRRWHSLVKARREAYRFNQSNQPLIKKSEMKRMTYDVLSKIPGASERVHQISKRAWVTLYELLNASIPREVERLAQFPRSEGMISVQPRHIESLNKMLLLMFSGQVKRRL